jgi:cell division protein FtsI (penicillin-binding protein 3)
MIGRLKELCRPLTPGSMCRPGQVRLEGVAKEAVETGRTRLLICGGVFAVAFLAISGRLVDLTILQPMEMAAERKAAARNVASGPDGRATITDRNGIILASDLPTYSLYADPKFVGEPRQAARALRRLFPELGQQELVAKLKSKRRFIWIRRHMTPGQYQQVIELGLSGFGVRRERRRIYPHGPLTAHLVGFTNTDNRGLAGLERYLDKTIRSSDDKIVMSIDIRVQHIVHEELSAAVKAFKAIGGSGLILDITTGEIVAMVSLPDFDPHEPDRTPAETRFNRNTLGVYEMGSTFKIFNTAMALDTGVASLDKKYDARHPLKISRFTISDYHGKGRWLSLAEVFTYSSNIGSARIAAEAGGARQRAFLHKLGLLDTPRLEVGEIAAPLFPSQWRPINTLTIAFGHGIAVTPVQMAAAVGGVANDGILVPSTLLKRDPGESLHGRRVVDSATSRSMRALMRLVVEKGTGKKADAEGYLVGGKTGTAEKASKRGYRRKALLSSFVAVYPVTKPRYLVFVTLDEPKGTKATHGYATGGWVAAPVVKQLILRTSPVLGVPPTPEPDPNTLDDGRDPKDLRPKDGNVKLVNGRRNESY